MVGSSGIDCAVGSTLIWGEIMPLIYCLTQTAVLPRAYGRGARRRAALRRHGSTRFYIASGSLISYNNLHYIVIIHNTIIMLLSLLLLYEEGDQISIK